jgi:hypothetical protein
LILSFGSHWLLLSEEVSHSGDLEIPENQLRESLHRTRV